MSTTAEVCLWETVIGAVTVEGPGQVARFEYTPEFARGGVQVSPLVMPLAETIYTFPALPAQTFHGLPGMLADALPDKFGNAVIDAWLASQGRLPQDIDAVERLCYTGNRGIGALEFRPARGPADRTSTVVHVDALVALANEVLNQRETLNTTFADADKEHALREILRVGASAGGARAKAVIAWNPTTNQVRSGQVTAPPGFEYWLMKFDGITNNRDHELADPQGFGAIEYAYSLMAKAAGIHMSDCRLFEEKGRRHFMTKRFDRVEHGAKLHMQSLGAIAHFDFNNPMAHSYEQALIVIQRLGLGMADIEEQFRRMAFNIIARNQDDHVKNIAFLMNKQGEWSLSPAFDMMYAYNPGGSWTAAHQMSANGKRDGFTLSDLEAVAESASMKRGRARTIVSQVTDAVRHWATFASQAGVNAQQIDMVQQAHRMDLLD